MELADPRLEVLNFGVSGYGLDQAFLRYITNGVDFQPRIVLICFMSWDIRRMVNTFRPFSYGGGGIPLAKPRFVLEADQLVLLGNPVSTLQGLEGLLRDDLKLFKKLGTHDYFAESSYAGTPGDFLALGRLMKLFVNRVWNGAKKEAILNEGVYNPSSEAYRITTKLLERFYEQVKSNASLPVIVLFPSRSDLERYFTKGETSYTHLVEYLDRKGYPYIDLSMPFKIAIGNKEKIAKFIPAHYSAEGNKLVAAYIYSFLNNRHFLEELTNKLSNKDH